MELPEEFMIKNPSGLWCAMVAVVGLEKTREILDFYYETEEMLKGLDEQF